MSDLVAALAPVADVLERMGVPYLLGGSVASSVHGVPRATMDVDLVAVFEPRHVAEFVAALAEDYYVDAGQIQRALDTRSSFNLIHHATVFKIDVFVSKGRAFDIEALARRQKEPLEDSSDARRFPVATPEDVFLAKLEWFDRGGRVSDRQWSDLLGIVRVQGDALDEEYLRRWADALGVADLLRRALEER